MDRSPPPEGKVTEAEYLAFERAHEFRHEYINGHVLEKPGSSFIHGTIAVNIAAALNNQRDAHDLPFYAFLIGMRVSIPSVTAYLYPDISAVWGETQVDDEFQDNLFNPTLIMEILSPTTAAYDRGIKFQQYREITSLQEYLLIDQDAPFVEYYQRQDNGKTWLFVSVESLDDTLELPSIRCTLSLADVYEDVDFDTSASG